MEEIWFYADGTARHGPVRLEALKIAVMGAPDPRRVLVWREGMANWVEAETLPELISGLPPSLPAGASLTQVPAPALRSSGDRSEAAEGPEDIEDGARQYRRLVGLVGWQILLGLGSGLLTVVSGPTLAFLVSLASLALGLALAVGTAVTAYRLSARIGTGVPMAWAVFMFVPCLNLIGLLILSSAAQRWCARYGIEVGLLGPTKASLDRLRDEARGR